MKKLYWVQIRRLESKTDFYPRRSKTTKAGLQQDFRVQDLAQTSQLL